MGDDLKSKLEIHDQYYTRVIEMIPTELYKHSVSEDADGAQEGKYANKRKLPLTNDERKNISKAKKAEKYAAPASVASAAVVPATVVAVEMKAADAVVSETVATPESSGSGDMDGLRQRLQVCNC